MNNIINYIAIFILLMLSAFFSASEIAFASANPIRIKSYYEKSRSKSSKLALKIIDKYDSTLSTILIGNNLVNIAASSIATVLVIDMLGDNYVFVATIVMTLLVLTFGEIIPKVLAKQFADKFARAVSVPIFILNQIFKPVTFLVMLLVKAISKLWNGNESDRDSVSEDDFENIIDIVEDEGVLDEDQCDLLQNALDFDNVLAYEIITPRVDMEAIDINDSYQKIINRITESSCSRIPVYDDTPDNIIGILHMNRFYKEYVDDKRVSIRDLLLPAVFVHKTMPLPDVLDKMRTTKSHMVIVLDEYGGTMGILTMEDVLEQLVGEIWDENDEIDKEFICIDETHFEALGDMRIEDFFDEFDIDIDNQSDYESDNITVGGWAVSMLDGEPEVDACFKFKNLCIKVIDTDGRRVDKIAVEETNNI